MGCWDLHQNQGQAEKIVKMLLPSFTGQIILKLRVITGDTS